MKKLILSAIFIVSTSITFAQYKKEFGGAIGFSNYLGDIGGGSGLGRDNISDLRWQQTRYTLNGYFRYKLNKNFSTRSSLIYARLSGADNISTNPERVARNLSFKTNTTEIAQTIEWNFYQQTKMSPRSSIGGKGGKKRMDFRAFAFAGVGVLYYNPRAELNGKTYNLRPLQTEGVSYSPITYTVPVGIGFAYTLNKTIRIGIDFSYRLTGSDYIDDVSGTYKYTYEDAMNAKPGDANYEAKVLGNRTPEIQSLYAVNNPNGGTQYNPNLPIGKNYGDYFDNNQNKQVQSIRGTSNDKDGYLLFNITAGYVIKGKNAAYKAKYRNIVNRRKVVKKKTRAKF